MGDRSPSGIFVILSRIDGDDTVSGKRGRRVDPDDIGMRVGRPHDDAVNLSMRIVVVDEIATAG